MCRRCSSPVTRGALGFTSNGFNIFKRQRGQSYEDAFRETGESSARYHLI